MPEHYDRMIGAPPIQKKWIVPRAALQFEYERPVFVPPPRRRRRVTNDRGPNWLLFWIILGAGIGIVAAQAVICNFPSHWNIDRDPVGLVRFVESKIDGDDTAR